MPGFKERARLIKTKEAKKAKEEEQREAEREDRKGRLIFDKKTGQYITRPPGSSWRRRRPVRLF